MKNEENEYSEKDLAASMGVDRDLLRQIRQAKFKEGEDFRKKGRAIILTEKALHTIKKVLFGKKPPQPAERPPVAPDAPDPEMVEAYEDTIEQAAQKARIDENSGKKPPLLLGPEVHTLIMHKKYRNKRIIGAYLGDKLMRVEVRNSHHFKRGMELPCVHVQQDLYKFVGKAPRGPKALRFPGVEEGGE